MDAGKTVVGQQAAAEPRRRAMPREVADRVALTEYERVTETLERLSPQQWSAPTCCPGWDVRAMAGHVLGMAQMAASVVEMVRQQAACGTRAKRDGVASVDALTALQVEKNAGLSTSELVERMRRVGPKAARGRRRMPGLVRNRLVPDEPERWTFEYLFDVILTRDPFLHRSDISEATGSPMTVTAEHEGVLVDDVVREWAGRHGAAYRLDLEGPAGGHWSSGEGGQEIRMDAIAFCRVLSGRGAGEGLLAVPVPF
jgi:uncharacterized protein (TIGR03083 family)